MMIHKVYPLSQIIDYLTREGIQVAVVQPSANTHTVSNEIINSSDLLKQRFITGIGTLQQAQPQQIAFLANARYSDQLATTQAGAVLLSQQQLAQCPTHTLALVVANPYVAYATLSQLFAYQGVNASNSVALPIIHPSAIIAPSAQLGKNVSVGAYCVIGDHVKIGDNSRLESHVCLEDFVTLGQGCYLKSHSFIGHHCELGKNVTLHSHASLGNEGFGFAPKGKPDQEGWQKIHQLGRVIIGDEVRVGSHTCIDRGALSDTVIGDHVIIDNLVQIAHNVQIGAGTAIAACVGIAGSSHVGKRCVLAGGVGLVGHIEICDDVTITGMTMVTKSIHQPGSYSSGTPMMPTNLWRKVAVKIKQLI